MSEQTRIRVLLVEDDEEDAVILMRHLGRMKQHRAQIEHVRGEPDARERLAAAEFDLLLVDLNLGGESSGIGLLNAIRAEGRDMPVVVVTGQGNETKAVEAMKSGAYDYLVKDHVTSDLLDHTVRYVRERRALEKERARMVERLAELTVTDELTGLANRRYLEQKLREETVRSDRTGHSFAVLMLDLDRFKDVNDRYGHQVGDDVLKRCAAALQRSVRATDVLARYGGEEFCIILPETDDFGGRTVADKLIRAVAGLPAPMPTISIGVALWQRGLSANDIVGRADSALYAAKAQGRNRFIVYGHGK